MAKQVLNLSDVDSTLEQVRCKAMAQRMDGCVFYNSCLSDCVCDSRLNSSFTYMVASDLAASGINS
jgi:hypothetical protein